MTDRWVYGQNRYINISVLMRDKTVEMCCAVNTEIVPHSRHSCIVLRRCGSSIRSCSL